MSVKKILAFLLVTGLLFVISARTVAVVTERLDTNDQYVNDVNGSWMVPKTDDAGSSYQLRDDVYTTALLSIVIGKEASSGITPVARSGTFLVAIEIIGTDETAGLVKQVRFTNDGLNDDFAVTATTDSNPKNAWTAMRTTSRTYTRRMDLAEGGRAGLVLGFTSGHRSHHPI